MTVPEPPSPLSILKAIHWASDCLELDHIDNARLNSELLLAYTVKYDRLNLYLNFDQPLTSQEIQDYSDLIRRRIQGEPVQYLIGSTEFYGRSFIVSPAVLIPRPETEILIDHVKPFLMKGINKTPYEPTRQLDLFDVNPMKAAMPLTVVDIGTGSGIIALTLTLEIPGITCYATDVSSSALLVAEQNAERLQLTDRVTFLEGAFTEPLSPKLEKACDLILSNPPYVVHSEIAQLPLEIRGFEPLVALDGGDDGLACFSTLVEEAPFFLKTGGMLAFEIGAEQAEAVAELFTESAVFSDIEVAKDYNQLDRVVSAVFTG